MTIRSFAWLLSITMILSATLGIMLPGGSARGLTNGEIRINPGGNWGWLYVSWHSSPTALDWNKFGGNPSGNIYWRSWSYRSDTSTPASLGTIVPSSNNTAVCYRTRAEYRDNSGATVSYSYYQHTIYNSASSFTLYGDDNWEFKSAVMASYAQAELDAACAWTGPHLHQYAGSWFTARTGSFLTTMTDYGLTGINDYQHSKSWSW